jgi:hypothetical protein
MTINQKIPISNDGIGLDVFGDCLDLRINPNFRESYVLDYSLLRLLIWKATKQRKRIINQKVRGEKDGAIQPHSKPGQPSVAEKCQTRSLNGQIPDDRGG